MVRSLVVGVGVGLLGAVAEFSLGDGVSYRSGTSGPCWFSASGGDAISSAGHEVRRIERSTDQGALN
jgi:hypothetical protein